MVNIQWKRINNVSGWLAVIVFVIAVLLVGIKQISDNDTLFHIKAGSYILEHGVPTTEVFTCSLSRRPWVDHEWLYQVVLYGISHAFGLNSIIGLQAVMTVLIFGILMIWGFRRDRKSAIVFFLFCVLLIFDGRSRIRPDNVSLLFSIVYIILIQTQLNKRWLLPFVMILQVIWANAHGFFIFGPILVGFFLLAEYLKRRARLPYGWNTVGRLNDKEFQHLKLIGTGALLACLANPQFINGFWYPFSVVLSSFSGSGYFFHYIHELKHPFNEETLLSQVSFPYYKVLFIFSLTSFILNRRHIDLCILFIWLFFLLFSIVSLRNLIFFAPFAYMVILINWAAFRLEDAVSLNFKNENLKYFLITLLTVVMICCIEMFSLKMIEGKYYDIYTKSYQPILGRVSEAMKPQKAADFLAGNKIHGNFFNNLACGAYLIYRTYPNIRVFIDGRTEVYGPKFFQLYSRIYPMGDMDLFKAKVKEDHITGVMISSVSGAGNSVFLQRLSQEQEWKKVYSDYDGVIFLKDEGDNIAVINKFKLDT